MNIKIKYALTVIIIILPLLSVSVSSMCHSSVKEDHFTTPNLNFCQNPSYTYSITYIGRIENVIDMGNLIEFDSVNLLKYSHISSSDRSFWTYSISHYEDSHHIHEGYNSKGIISDSFIFARLTKTI